VADGQFPAVVDNLEVNEVNDGLIIYDSATDRVHHLNSTAAIVFTMCDGQTSAESIARVLSEGFGLEESPIAHVTACLDRLSAQGLLQ